MKTETTFEDVVLLYPEFNDSKFFPDPAKPLPTTLGSDWGLKSQEVQEMLASNTPEAIKKISLLTHHSENFIKTVILARKAWLLVMGGVVITILGALLEGWVVHTLLGSPPSVRLVIAPMFCTIVVIVGLIGRALSVTNDPAHALRRRDLPDDLLQDTYRERVQEWSMKRYGRKVDHLRWTAMDCVYGEDSTFVSGEMPNRVYCYEQPGGWILGDAEGVELPLVMASTR